MTPPPDPFFGTSGPRDARIALVGEAWGTAELNSQKPFVGPSGEILTKMLEDAGIRRADCFLTNVIPAVPPRSRLGKPEMFMFFEETRNARKSGLSSVRGLYPSESIRRSLEALHLQLETVRPTVIVALGNYALWALVDHPHLSTSDEEGRKVPTGITLWRGSQHLVYNTGRGVTHTPIPVIPTFNPAAIMNQWAFRAPAVHDLRKRLKPVTPPSYNFIVSPSYAVVMDTLRMLRDLPSGSWLSRDYETAKGHADCLGIAWSPTDAITIPFFDPSTGAAIWSLREEAEIREGISDLFRKSAGTPAPRDNLHDDGPSIPYPLPGHLWSGQNFNYELQYEDKWFDSTTPSHHDTMIAHHVLWPGTPMDLTYLSSLYCSYHRYWGEAHWWEKSGDVRERWLYNSEDAARTWEITQALESLVDSMGFRSQFSERMRVSRANLSMMLRGIRIDLEERRRQSLQVFLALQEMESAFHDTLPSFIPPIIVGKGSKPSPWFRSPSQLCRLFYSLFGQPEHRDKKTRALTIDDDALRKIAAREPLLAELCESILSYRSAGVFHSNFLSAELDPDGRMRCSIGEGPVSFRMRSGKNAFGRGTNLQNVPKEKNA